jgi:hypothetical protein
MMPGRRPPLKIGERGWFWIIYLATIIGGITWVLKACT